MCRRCFFRPPPKREVQGVVVFHDGSHENIYSHEDLERHFGRTDKSPLLAGITKLSAISREELEAMVSPYKVVDPDIVSWPVSTSHEPDPDGVVIVEELDVEFERAVPVALKKSVEIASKHDVCVEMKECDDEDS